VLASALTTLSDRLNSKFLIAYWLPAFVGVLGSLGILAGLVGPSRMEAWVFNLDSVEQTLVVLIVVLAISILAFVLRAVSRPIIEVFTGIALPRGLARWSTKGQMRAKLRASQTLGAQASALCTDSGAEQVDARLNRVYPLDDAATQPTLFGNVFATAAEYPRLVYTMNGLLWWPRLVPLVPGSFQDLLSSAQAPMMALLNLCVVFTTLALGGAPLLALVGGHWVAAIVVLVGGLLLARLCYQAGVSQAAELGSVIRVGFDLYRHEILRQMDLEVPQDFETERALWHRLTAQLLGLPPEDPPASESS